MSHHVVGVGSLCIPAQAYLVSKHVKFKLFEIFPELICVSKTVFFLTRKYLNSLQVYREEKNTFLTSSHCDVSQKIENRSSSMMFLLINIVLKKILKYLKQNLNFSFYNQNIMHILTVADNALQFKTRHYIM